MDSDNEKKQQSANESKTPEKLSNGCADTKAEQEMPEAAGTATIPATVAATAPATVAATVPATAVATTAGTVAETPPPATAAATPPATAAATAPAAEATTEKVPQLNNNAQKEAPIKPAPKLNGIKRSSKKKKQLPESVKRQAKQAISNGQINGKEEQPPVELKEQQQLPAKQLPVNGKTKKHNNKIPVNNVNKASKPTAKTAAPPAPVAGKAEVAPAASTDATVPAAGKDAAAPVEKDKPNVEPVEPPAKRPKLQLAQTSRKKSQDKLKQAAAAASVVDVVDEEEEEDISDEAYIARHQRALIEERRRFETFLKFPWSTRSRANRRVDSRAESSGANTPDPTSPAASQLAGPTADNESIPSPLAQTTQQHPLDALSGDGEITKRRRTTSSKLKDHDRRSNTPDTRDVSVCVSCQSLVLTLNLFQQTQDPPPFEPLQFPLSEEVYQRLLAEMYAEPKEPAIPAAPAKRTKSKSVSSNGDGSTTTAGRRRSSKAKATSGSKLAQSAAPLNGSKNAKKSVAPHINGAQDDGYDDVIDYEPDEDENELLLEEDDDYHYLAAPDDQLPSGTNNANAYNASIDAYLGEHEALDDEELADDPFMDDDPNDPEWKRSIGVRHERMRKRV